MVVFEGVSVVSEPRESLDLLRFQDFLVENS